MISVENKTTTLGSTHSQGTQIGASLSHQSDHKVSKENRILIKFQTPSTEESRKMNNNNPRESFPLTVERAPMNNNNTSKSFREKDSESRKTSIHFLLADKEEEIDFENSDDNPPSIFIKETNKRKQSFEEDPVESFSASEEEMCNTIMERIKKDPTLANCSPKYDKRRRRTRTVMTPYQINLLNEEIKRDRFPSSSKKAELSQLLGVSQKTIQVWFQNQRQKLSKEEKTFSKSPYSNIHQAPYALAQYQYQMKYLAMNPHYAETILIMARRTYKDVVSLKQLTPQMLHHILSLYKKEVQYIQYVHQMASRKKNETNEPVTHTSSSNTDKKRHIEDIHKDSDPRTQSLPSLYSLLSAASTMDHHSHVHFNHHHHFNSSENLSPLTKAVFNSSTNSCSMSDVIEPSYMMDADHQSSSTTSILNESILDVSCGNRLSVLSVLASEKGTALSNLSSDGFLSLLVEAAMDNYTTTNAKNEKEKLIPIKPQEDTVKLVVDRDTIKKEQSQSNSCPTFPPFSTKVPPSLPCTPKKYMSISPKLSSIGAPPYKATLNKAKVLLGSSLTYLSPESEALNPNGSFQSLRLNSYQTIPIFSKDHS